MTNDNNITDPEQRAFIAGYVVGIAIGNGDSLLCDALRHDWGMAIPKVVDHNCQQIVCPLEFHKKLWDGYARYVLERRLKLTQQVQQNG